VNRDQQQINQSALLAGIVGQVGCVTVVLVAIALGAGVFLDNLLGTKPIFTILFLVGSVPVTLYIIVRISLTAVARVLPAPPAENLEEETKE
jgi:F0F1-type ATP synthase assembly protein I